MHPNIKILTSVLTRLSIPFKKIYGFPDALEVNGSFFIRSITPFNNESVGALCRDKDAVFKLLDGVVRMPKTKSFLDPHGNHSENKKAMSLKRIVEFPLDFLYPRIVKMNRGRQGNNVFIVNSDRETETALSLIFNKQSKEYDYIALIQEYIQPKREIRVMVSLGKPVFGYDRKTKQALGKKEYSVCETESLKILAKIPLSWGALDFIEAKDGSLYFLEVNTMPELGEETIMSNKKLIEKLYTDALDALYG